MIEDVLAAHFIAEKKISSEAGFQMFANTRSREVQSVVTDYTKEQVQQMLKKCINPEMLYHFVHGSFD